MICVYIFTSYAHRKIRNYVDVTIAYVTKINEINLGNSIETYITR